MSSEPEFSRLSHVHKGIQLTRTSQEEKITIKADKEGKNEIRLSSSNQWYTDIIKTLISVYALVVDSD